MVCGVNVACATLWHEVEALRTLCNEGNFCARVDNTWYIHLAACPAHDLASRVNLDCMSKHFISSRYE